MTVESCMQIGIGRMLGFEKYMTIMQKVQSVDVSTDVDFQTVFDDYYEVRRNQVWRKAFFSYFQSIKNDEEICFNRIIEYIYENLKTNKGAKHPVEASFSSKMLATINPQMPILDSQVLKIMDLSIIGTTAEKKLESAKNVYQAICVRYNQYIGTPDCKDVIAVFDQFFPDYHDISTIKKIDWFLWGFSADDLKKTEKFKALFES